MQIINLEFEKSQTKLAGNPFGRQVYSEQVKNKINYNDEVTFIFPERIDGIATSFIQGFFADMVKNIGITGIKNMVTIQSSIPNLKNIVLYNLEV